MNLTAIREAFEQVLAAQAKYAAICAENPSRSRAHNEAREKAAEEWGAIPDPIWETVPWADGGGSDELVVIKDGQAYIGDRFRPEAGWRKVNVLDLDADQAAKPVPARRKAGSIAPNPNGGE